MRIGFYAPLKPADHPAPSGDRRMARLLITALSALGHDVAHLSTLRSFNRTGDSAIETATIASAAAEVERLAAAWRDAPDTKPDLLFTYHVYHKAADYIGPALQAAFGIPYVIAEPSVAPKRRDGPWSTGYAQAGRAIRSADALLAMTDLDRACLADFANPARVIAFPPFLDPAPFAAAAALRAENRNILAQRLGLPNDEPWLLAVGMMRDGDKLASYRSLAAALSHAQSPKWQLILVGDGPERAAITAAFAPFAARTRFTGQCAPEELADIYAASDLYVWPAVNEAYGMALLEAQAAGLPVLSVDTRGVPDVVAHGETGWLVADAAPESLAGALRDLLAAPARVQAMRPRAMERVRGTLSLARAQERLQDVFGRLGLPQ